MSNSTLTFDTLVAALKEQGQFSPGVVQLIDDQIWVIGISLKNTALREFLTKLATDHGVEYQPLFNVAVSAHVTGDRFGAFVFCP